MSCGCGGACGGSGGCGGSKDAEQLGARPFGRRAFAAAARRGGMDLSSLARGGSLEAALAALRVKGPLAAGAPTRRKRLGSAVRAGELNVAGVTAGAPASPAGEGLEYLGRTSRRRLRSAASATLRVMNVKAVSGTSNGPSFAAGTGTFARVAKLAEPSMRAGAFAPLALGGVLGSTQITIGDASFYVPNSFWANREWVDELKWQDALERIWPLQTARLAAHGLTDEEIDGLWACIDLDDDDGEFFSGSLPAEIGSSGKLGGYAGWMFYWATQSVAMYWGYTKDGVHVPATATDASDCFGIDRSATRLFRLGTQGGRWHVNGSKTWGADTWFYCYPGWECWMYYPKCDAGVHTDECQGKMKPPGSAYESEHCACVDYPYTANDIERDTNASSDYELVVTSQVAVSGAFTVSKLSTELNASATDLDSDASHAYSENSPCRMHFKAEWIGRTGLVVDYLLMWAHVAMALSKKQGYSTTPEGQAYYSAALLIGRYAFREIVDYGKLVVHELGHNYLGEQGHRVHSCCMCTTAQAWYTGVCAELGLPDAEASIRHGFSNATSEEWRTYQEVILELDDLCSRESTSDTDEVMSVTTSTNNYWSHLTWYGSPGEVGGTRIFMPSACSETDSQGNSVTSADVTWF